MHVVCVLVASFEIVCSSPRVFVACLCCCVGFWYCGHVGFSDFRVRQSFAVGTQEVTDQWATGPLPLLREREGDNRPQMLHSVPVGGNNYGDNGGRGKLFCKKITLFSVFS